MSNKRVFGHVPGVSIGTTFDSFVAMHAVGLHNHTQAGISGSAKQGAESIVISGGYEDDRDFGNEIIYTGQGGRDASNNHVEDQKLERGNQALVVSEIEGLPLRVIRGADRKNKFAPATGYRYDGLFRVESHWFETGRSGFKVWQYRLVTMDSTDEPVSVESDAQTNFFATEDNAPPPRICAMVQRIVRDTSLAKQLKHYHRHRCQVCGIQINTGGGPYAEAAHIRPLGRPHNGPDVWENILCLCPNHHVMFDLGAFSIADDYSLIGMSGALKVRMGHTVGTEYLAYHRDHFKNLLG
jgi:putative restriction endonuclease